jgi:hypothetical protein
LPDFNYLAHQSLVVITEILYVVNGRMSAVWMKSYERCTSDVKMQKK